MAMTREQVLAEMEADFEVMTQEERDGVLFTDSGTDWTPNLLIQAVRDNTEFGQQYVTSWSVNKEQKAGLMDLLTQLLGGGGGMTCGDPDCPNCKGEVRPFDALPGTGTDDEEPTLH
jgi:hypothetical protein